MDYPLICKKIEDFIYRSVEKAGSRGVVLGLSGGVDSAVVAVLSARALGPENVLGFMMPSPTNLPHDLEDAHVIARHLGINTKIISLKSILEAFTAHLDHDKTTVGNLTARIRMCLLYYEANHLNYLVAGTGNKSELSVGYFCYDKDTRALTTDGLKGYTELKIGDRVLSMDLDSRQVVESPVADVHVFDDYDGPMLVCGGGKGTQMDIMVTPNHRMLLDRVKGPQFCRADELPRRQTPMPLPQAWSGEKRLTSFFQFDNSDIHHNANKFLPMPINDFLYIMGLYIGDGHAQASPIASIIKGTGLKRDKQTGRFVSTDAPMVPKDYIGYRTWFALPEGTASRHKLIAILRRNAIKYGLTPIQISVNGKPFYRAMAECGKSSITKHIPPWVLAYPSKNLVHLLRGLRDSDGGSNNSYYYTISPRLASQMAELGCKLGKNILMRTREPRTSIRKDGVPIHCSKSYEISLYGKGRRWLSGAKFKSVSYTGVVWCPDIPHTHNLLVERNGRFMFCGNTKYGDGGCDILPIGDLYKTEVWELARFLGVPQKIIERVPTAGLWPGQTDEGELGISYEELDKILQGKKDNIRVQKMVNASEHKRRPPEVCKL